MKELDHLLTRYLEHRYELAPAAERAAFESLLDLQDPQIMAYCMGRDQPADLAVAALIRRLLDWRANGS
jgi:succinate dehydrogenase flavin-adding protein (antitoxin of CptAB toxin-antitoxin module)